jgi:hypothetical protein
VLFWCYIAKHPEHNFLARAYKGRLEQKFEALMELIDSGAPAFKVMLSYYQIASGLAYVFDIPLPPISKKLMKIFASICNMNFIEIMPIGCLAPSDFYVTLMVYTILPIPVSTIIYAYYKSLKVPDVSKSGEREGEDQASWAKGFGDIFFEKHKFAERQLPEGEGSGLNRSDRSGNFLAAVDRIKADELRRASVGNSDSSNGGSSVTRSKKVLHSDAHSPNRRLRNRIFATFLILTFLMLPSVTVKIFSTFACTHFEGDYGSFLKADYSLDCTTPKHKSFQMFAGFMVLVYPIGIPCMYYCLLNKVKDRIECGQSSIEELVGEVEGKNQALAIREQNESDDEGLKRLGFLYSMYEPKAWWFEIFETCRRLMLTAGIIFLSPGTASQIVMSMLICLGAMRVYSGVKPFIEDKDDVLAEAAQWQLFFTMFAALAIKVQLDGESLQDVAFFDAAVVALQVMTPFVFVLQYFFLARIEAQGGIWAMLWWLVKARMWTPCVTFIDAAKNAKGELAPADAGDVELENIEGGGTEEESGATRQKSYSSAEGLPSPKSQLRELRFEQELAETASKLLREKVDENKLLADESKLLADENKLLADENKLLREVLREVREGR